MDDGCAGKLNPPPWHFATAVDAARRLRARREAENVGRRVHERPHVGERRPAGGVRAAHA